MTNRQWLEFLLNVGRGLRERLGKLAGTVEAQKQLGRGAGGDITVFIDKVAEDYIISRLEEGSRQGFKCTLISEEAGLKPFGDEDLFLMVDPIDGSLNAKRGIPLYSASFALIRGTKLESVEVGLVINLATGQEFWAQEGEGSYLDDRSINISSSGLRETLTYELPNPKVNFKQLQPVFSHFNKVRNLGSLALDLCFFAQGACDAFIMPGPARPLDFAAGLLLVREAGGQVVEITGKSLDSIPVTTPKVKGLIAAKNQPELKQIMNWMKPARKSPPKR